MSDTASPSSKVTYWTPFKQWFISAALPFVICLSVFVCVVISLSDDEDKPSAFTFMVLLFGTAFLAIYAIANGYYAFRVYRDRRKIRKNNPTLPIEALNELVFKEYLQQWDNEHIKTRVEKVAEFLKNAGADYHPSFFEKCVEPIVIRRFWRRYFSIDQELLDEWTRQYFKEKKDLELKVKGEAKDIDMQSYERFEKMMDNVGLNKIMDYFTFKRFIISDMITLLWIGASIIDIYVFITYLQGLDKQVFVILLLLSLVAIRIIAEYTVVLFSIADLTREVRDELRTNNVLREDEKIDDES